MIKYKVKKLHHIKRQMYIFTLDKKILIIILKKNDPKRHFTLCVLFYFALYHILNEAGEGFFQNIDKVWPKIMKRLQLLWLI